MNPPHLYNKLTSKLLSPMPTVTRKRNPIGLMIRWIVGGLVVALFVLPTFIVLTRALPESGFGYFLYSFHDNVFLPAKGQFYTRFFPTSLYIGLPIVTFVTLLFLVWLVRLSMVRQPHIRLLRLCARNRWTHRSLIVTAKAFRNRLRLEPRMMQEVTHDEWRDVLEELETFASPAAPKRLARLANLTLLSYALQNLPVAPPITGLHLASVAAVHRAYLVLHLYKDAQSASLVISVLGQPEDWPDATSGQNRAFDPSALIGDVLMLDRARNELAKLPDDEDNSLAQLGLDDMLSEIAHRVDRRSDQLRIWSRQFERDANRTRLFGGGAQNNPFELQAQAWTAVGQLALDIALHIAWLSDAPALGLRTLDTFDASKLLSALFADQVDPSMRSLLEDVLEPLFAASPSEFHRSLAAGLLNDQLKRRELQWRESGFAGEAESPVRSHDLDLGRYQVAALLQAAGPEHGPIEIAIDER